MKKILLKIIFALIIIGLIFFGIEKFFINEETGTVQEISEENIKENIETNIEVNKDNTKTVEIPKKKKLPENTSQINCLVIGNSITLERAGIGMAASDEFHDYYYLIKSRLDEKYDKVNMNRISAIDWEENRKISSRTDWIQSNLTPDLISNQNLVIFQIGDNTVPTETFEESVTELVNHVKKYSPDSEMVLVGMWFINEERLAMMPELAEKLEMDFVNISDLVVDENKSYIGAEVIGINGQKDLISTIEEAFHPNDEGMRKIADRICNTLGL